MSANPYKEGTALWIAWNEGYHALMLEYGERVESLTISLRAELKKLKRPETPSVN
jgi:hypothetical protein